MPPATVTAFVVGGMAKDIPLHVVFKGIVYFLPAYAVCVLLLLFFPQIAIFLPNLMR